MRRPKLSFLQVIMTASLALMALALNACTLTPQPMTLVAENHQHCGTGDGVELDGSLLTLRAGQRPTPGYAVELLSQTRRSDHLQITYRVSEPPPGRMLAQVMTSPCTRVQLPEHWQSLRVVNQDTGEVWDFGQP